MTQSKGATPKLPDKPSELIRVALTDLEAKEVDPRYEVHMGTWHEPLYGMCLVCLAGSVMAGTLRRSAEDMLEPSDFDEDTRKKLFALDKFRASVYNGLWLLGHELPRNFPNPDRTPPSYQDDPEGFKAALRQMADDLEGAGL